MTTPSSIVHRKRTSPIAPRRAFTLVELLVVVAIMALVAAIAVPAVQGPGGARQFANQLGQVTGILEQARSYALAQNTYVWVAFYPYDPSALAPSDRSGEGLAVAAFASDDGTDPIDWAAASVDMTPAGTVAGVTLSPILRTAVFRQMALRPTGSFGRGTGAGQIASLPAGIGPTPTGPASVPTFRIRVKGAGAASLSLPVSTGGATSISVVQFTPSGAARIDGSQIDSVWIDFQRVKGQGQGAADPDAIAALRVSGLTGLTTVYRK